MADVYDCSDTDQLLAGLRAARRAIAQGGLVVTPTDTVYGIAADAFNAAAVGRLLAAKRRGRDFPPPVLVPDEATLAALAAVVPSAASELVRRFWPGGLTVVLTARPGLDWDLGDTGGTVAIRMPDDRVCLELLRDTGPLAVSSANVHGRASALTADDAQEMLGDAVAVYLDEGAAQGGVASTILDMRSSDDGEARVLRRGAIPLDAIEAALGDVRIVG